MPGFVKTAADEKVWSKAKNIAKDRGLSGDSMYAYANAVFHKMKESIELTENDLNLLQEKIDVYSQIDYPIKSLNEEEIWHIMNAIMTECEHFNKKLEEENRYLVLEYLFNNYKTTINENDYSRIKEYVEGMVIPNAKCSYNDKEIQYGVISEDYISGGYGGVASNDYGIGGTGYYGANNRRSGFGGPRGGGQMSRRATGNPDRVITAAIGDEPVEVNIEPKQSNYKPWEVQLTPNGEKVNNIERNKVQNDIDDEWNSELGAMIQGLEYIGLNLNELEDMSQEQIEDLMIKKLKKVGQDFQKEMGTQLTEDMNIPDKITALFEDDIETLEEKLQKHSRIQDAREVLSTKHQVHKAIEKNKDRAYVIDQYGVEKLMKQYGYVYDDNNLKWLKKAHSPSPEDVKPKSSTDTKPTDIKAPKNLPDEDKEKISKPEDFNVVGDVPEKQSSETTDGLEKLEPTEKDYNKFKTIKDPVTLESKLKPLMARFIISLSQESKEPSEFELKDNGLLVPKIEDKEVLLKMHDRKLEWNGEKDIWVDDTNTLPEIIFNSGDSRQSLLARSYLASMGEIAAIQFDMEHNPLFSAEESNNRMESHGYVWNGEVNKWLYNQKDLAESLNESVLYEQEPKKPEIKLAIPDNKAEELQARFLYRAIQLKALENVPDWQKPKIDAIKDQIIDPTLDLKSLNINIIEKLLTGKGSAVNDNTSDKNNNETKKVEETLISRMKQLFSEQDDELTLSGDEENDPADELSIQGDPEEDKNEPAGNTTWDMENDDSDLSKVLLDNKNNIVPNEIYEWNDNLHFWVEGRGSKAFPSVLEDKGENIQSFTGRAIIAQKDLRAIQFEESGMPLMDKDRVLRILKQNDIKWSDKRNIWFTGTEIDEEDIQEELNELENLLKKNDDKILKRYNNGTAFNGDIIPITEYTGLVNAIIAKKIIAGGKLSEKEWYYAPEGNELEIKKGEDRREKERNIFKEKYDIRKEKIEDENVEPELTHKITIKPKVKLGNILKKKLMAGLKNVTKGLLKASLGTAGNLIKTGAMILAASQGYQGPFMFMPFGKDSYKKIWNFMYANKQATSLDKELRRKGSSNMSSQKNKTN